MGVLAMGAEKLAHAIAKYTERDEVVGVFDRMFQPVDDARLQMKVAQNIGPSRTVCTPLVSDLACCSRLAEMTRRTGEREIGRVDHQRACSEVRGHYCRITHRFRTRLNEIDEVRIIWIGIYDYEVAIAKPCGIKARACFKSSEVGQVIYQRS